MRLSISNIAWDVAEDEAVAALLGRFGVDAIDVAPAKYFPQPATASDAGIARVRRWWADRGIEVVGMQSLLFGTQGLNLFGAPVVQDAMIEHLSAVCRIGAGLGAPRLVFGSPRNRDRSALSDAAALETAVAFFRRLGDVAGSHGVQVCLEANPAVFGTNFMLTTDQAAEVVRSVGHPFIRLQFDTGTVATDADDPEAALQAHAALVGHVHASEPGLVPLGDAGEAGARHDAMATALRRYLPGHIVSVEMVATGGESHVTSIERALRVALRHYGPDHNGRSTGRTG